MKYFEQNAPVSMHLPLVVNGSLFKNGTFESLKNCSDMYDSLFLPHTSINKFLLNFKFCVIFSEIWISSNFEILNLVFWHNSWTWCIQWCNLLFTFRAWKPTNHRPASNQYSTFKALKYCRCLLAIHNYFCLKMLKNVRTAVLLISKVLIFWFWLWLKMYFNGQNLFCIFTLINDKHLTTLQEDGNSLTESTASSIDHESTDH